jgi:PAS domain S-box-containing protein
MNQRRDNNAHETTKAGTQATRQSHAPAGARRLAAIVESSSDAIVAKDLNGIVTDWNPAAEKIFGYAAAEIIGTPITQIIPPERLAEEDFILSRIRRGETVASFETLRQTKDGRQIHVSVTVSPIKDDAGHIIGASKIARDITAQKQHEQELARLNRLYAALSRVNHAIIRLPARDTLFQEIAQILVEHAGFSMAWIGWHDPDTRRMLPVAICGDRHHYLDGLEIYTDDRPEGRGPTGRAFRTGQAFICNDSARNPITAPWREKLLRCGFQATAAFPIRLKNAVCGVLTVYAEEPEFFQQREIALIEEAADDLSFALDNLADREERRRAEASAENERRFSATMIESMPGIIYFYDEQGRFLRWNRNFETVSGYSSAEIATMHPLDFFAPADRELLQARIGEVFARGDSFVEAPFRTKDGRTVPYFFTGRRIEFNGQPCLVGMGVDITARKQAEQELRRTQASWDVVLENLREGLIIADADGKLFRWNAAALRMYGFDKAKHGQVHLAALRHVFELSEIDGSVLPLDEWPFARVLRGETVSGMELRIRRREGGWERIFSYAGSQVRYLEGKTLSFLTVQDITERKQAELGLREIQGQLEAVVENLRAGLVIADPDATLLRWNPASLRMLGFEDLAEGRRCQREFERIFELFALDGVPLPPEQWPLARTRRGEDIQDLELRVRRTGEDWERVISYAGRRVAYAGDKLLAFLTMRDITKQKQAEMALKVLNQTLKLEVGARTEELQSALERAEAADRLKSAFLATMSHELRTPLNSIIGFTGIVLQGLAGPLNEEQTKQLGMVRGSARHLLELINDVLDISKIEAGQLAIRAEPFDLTASLERVTGLVKPLVTQKGLTLIADFLSDLGEMVGDRRRVEQILINLLNNAIKFTEQGSVTFTAGRTTMPSESAAASPACVRFSVADTGIGIRPEDLSVLFQPFRQLDTGLTRQHEGTGLGLAICHRLAELMGGRITVQSQWQRGSEFTLLLPLDQTKVELCNAASS